MPYAIRVRLYCGDELAADTDPDLEPGEPGAEVVTDLAASQAALLELCQAFHGAADDGPWLLGFGAAAMAAYGAVLRDRARGGTPFTYVQGYSVMIDTPKWRSATMWQAHVDIVVSR